MFETSKGDDPNVMVNSCESKNEISLNFVKNVGNENSKLAEHFFTQFAFFEVIKELLAVVLNLTSLIINSRFYVDHI